MSASVWADVSLFSGHSLGAILNTCLLVWAGVSVSGNSLVSTPYTWAAVSAFWKLPIVAIFGPFVVQ